MRIISYFFVALLSISLLITNAIAHKKFDNTIVDTKYGMVEGYKVNGFDVIAWKGLPYAKPPVEDLRWKKPENPASWPGIRDAFEYGNSCRGNEDCLYLNVWSPDSKGKKGKKGGLIEWKFNHCPQQQIDLGLLFVR